MKVSESQSRGRTGSPTVLTRDRETWVGKSGGPYESCNRAVLFAVPLAPPEASWLAALSPPCPYTAVLPSQHIQESPLG